MSTYEPENDPDYVDVDEIVPEAVVPVHPFINLIKSLPAAQKLSMYEALLKAASDQLQLAHTDIALLQVQQQKAKDMAAEQSNRDQQEGFSRALASVRASLQEWPEGACDMEISRLVSLIVHKAVTDQAGALWVSAAIEPTPVDLGKEYIVAVRRSDLPPSMLTPDNSYWKAIAVWNGANGGWLVRNGSMVNTVHPDYYHALPRNPHPVFGSGK